MICFYCSYEQCGCVNPLIWDTRSIVSPVTNNIFQAPLCDFLNNCTTTAAKAYLELLSEGSEDDSKCQQECSMVDFIIKKSSLLTPVEWQMAYIKGFVENDSSVPLPANWSNLWPDYIRTNYLAISVVRETNVVEINTQQASISIIDLFSNIGGQTGLWIGISFLSIMELVEMLYRLARYQCYVIRSVIRRKQQATPP